MLSRSYTASNSDGLLFLFLQINSSPYIFELFLNDAVIERKTKLTIRENEVVVELQKKTPLLWTSLGCQANCINVTEQIQNTIAEEHKKAKKYAKELESKLCSFRK